MKSIRLVLCCIVSLTSIARAETAKVGDLADYSLTVISEYSTHVGSTSGSNAITTITQLTGGYTCLPRQEAADFDTSSANFFSRLKGAAEADGWTLDPQMTALSIFGPCKITILARRSGAFLHISAFLFQLDAGRMGIAYTQGIK
jgi:hypothetical protein